MNMFIISEIRCRSWPRLPWWFPVGPGHWPSSWEAGVSLGHGHEPPGEGTTTVLPQTLHPLVLLLLWGASDRFSGGVQVWREGHTPAYITDH